MFLLPITLLGWLRMSQDWFSHCFGKTAEFVQTNPHLPKDFFFSWKDINILI